jgi:hypothetical protein
MFRNDQVMQEGRRIGERPVRSFHSTVGEAEVDSQGSQDQIFGATVERRNGRHTNKGIK